MAKKFPYGDVDCTALCIPSSSYDGIWGYTLCNLKSLLSNTPQNMYKPFWYYKYPLETAIPVIHAVNRNELYVSERKPFNLYTSIVTDKVDLRPLKEDAVVVAQSSIVELLEKLTLEYKYQYMLRNARMGNINESLCASKSIKDKYIYCSIFRVQDVLPADIINTDGVYVKVHDGSSVFIDIVFSDIKQMFDTDGFCFKPKFSFEEVIIKAEQILYALDNLKSGKPLIKERKPQPRKLKQKITTTQTVASTWNTDWMANTTSTYAAGTVTINTGTRFTRY